MTVPLLPGMRWGIEGSWLGIYVQKDSRAGKLCLCWYKCACTYDDLLHTHGTYIHIRQQPLPVDNLLRTLYSVLAHGNSSRHVLYRQPWSPERRRRRRRRKLLTIPRHLTRPHKCSPPTSLSCYTTSIPADVSTLGPQLVSDIKPAAIQCSGPLHVLVTPY
jgi:hypothetical protein